MDIDIEYSEASQKRGVDQVDEGLGWEGPGVPASRLQFGGGNDIPPRPHPPEDAPLAEAKPSTVT